MLTEVFNIIGLQLTSKLNLRQKESIRRTYSLKCPINYDARLFSREEAVERTVEDEGVDMIAEENLTSCDVRMLMQAEEELSQTKGFTRLLPDVRNTRYLKYLDRRLHGDLLLSAWEERYHSNRHQGRQILSRLSLQGKHLQ